MDNLGYVKGTLFAGLLITVNRVGQLMLQRQ